MSRASTLALLLSSVLTTIVRAQQPPSKIPPRIQVVPQPYSQISFQRDGSEIARYHFAKDLRRPFVFPLIGPSGRSLTRMGHPRDPESHSHHNSVWIAHHDVGGVGFWNDVSKGRIVHQRIESMDESAESAWVISINHWTDDAGNILLVERRRTMVHLLNDQQWLLILDLQFEPKHEITLGKTPFGPIGVRMAKTIGVHDGGGTIRNSAGQTNEKEVFWKPAKWVDYSGPITLSASEGITLMDHPANPGHPTPFHVRDDGWIGASLNLNSERKLSPSEPLRLKYALFIHRGQPDIKSIDQGWTQFSQTPLLDLPPKK